MPWRMAWQPCRGGECQWCAAISFAPPAVQCRQRGWLAHIMHRLLVILPPRLPGCQSNACLPACLQEDAHIAELELDATKTALFSGEGGRRRQAGSHSLS